MNLESDAAGPGEPVVCNHGACVADAFLPLLSELRLIDRYRVREGWLPRD